MRESPSKRVKKLGVKNLKRVSEVSGVEITTLNRWNTSRPFAFDAVSAMTLLHDADINPEHTQKISAIISMIKDKTR